MKTPLLFILTTLFFSGMAGAQPVITLQDATPAFGTSITMMTAMYASPGDAGANQIWNLGGMFADNSNEVTYLAPGGLPDSEQFPDATHTGFSDTFSEAYAYFSFSDNRIEELGYVSSSEGTSVETVFSDPKLHAQFPINYGDLFSDTYASETVNEFTIDQETTVNIITETGSFDAEVDGYGTLITPAGTYENVLRIVFEIEEAFTVNSNGEDTSSGERVTTEYQYFKAGFPMPLVTLTNTIFYMDGKQVDQFASGAYMSNISVGLSETQKTVADVQLFPVPAQSMLNVSIQSEKSQQVHFSLIATDGKEVYNWPAHALSTGEQQVELMLPEVSEGIYLFRVQTDAGVTTRKLAIGR